MIAGGKGGGNTTTGNVFEKKSNVFNSIGEKEGFSIKENSLYYEEEKLAISADQHKFYSFLKENGINWKDIISKKLLPDNAIITKDKVIIFEAKFQKTPGSVDEKLQTCLFKKRQYQKLCYSLDKEVVYAYILNDWFRDYKYFDVLNYIEEVGCHYFFNEVPLEFIFD